MSDAVERPATPESGPSRVPATFGERLRYIGPGLVVAVTGVGAGDMVSSLVAGTDYGTTFLWAIVVGALLKFFLTEGQGRWFMATGQTIMQGWYNISPLASGYFLVYLLLATFVFGAAVTTTASLALVAMFPGGPPLWLWAVMHSIAALIIVGVGRYVLFENVMKVFAGLKFVIMIGLAILLAPNLGELAVGFVPTLPEGSLLFALAVIGGVGGTFTLASYTYWTREKGWSSSPWIPMMRLDLAAGYILTALFMFAMLIIGTELLFGTGQSIESEDGLAALANPIRDEFGALARWVFLIGFWAVSVGAMLGSWNGSAHLFADTMRIFRRVPEERREEYLSEKSPWFRGFLLWITFPPMILLYFDQGIFLVIIYAALGALFFPFLAATLLYMLNSRQVPREYRNGIISNAILVLSVLLFVVIGAQQILGSL